VFGAKSSIASVPILRRDLIPRRPLREQRASKDGPDHACAYWSALRGPFEAPQGEVEDLADRLRSRFPSDPEYAARWANLPAGARPLENPLGGAPGFVVGNVYVMPGLPAEMKAMFATVTPELETEGPITSWRRTYETTEAKIVGVLEAMGDRYPGVLVGSYPKFHTDGATVEVVVKSADPAALEAAVAWLEQALEEATG